MAHFEASTSTRDDRMEYGFEDASLEGHKGKRRQSSRAAVDPLAAGGLGDGLGGGADVDPLIASGSMSASAAVENPSPAAPEPAPEAESMTVDMSKPPGQMVKEPADDDDNAGDDNPAENSETESSDSGESANPNDEAPASPEGGSDESSDEPESSDKKSDKKGGSIAPPAAPAPPSAATDSVGGAAEGGSAAPISTTDPIMAPAIGNPSDLKPTDTDPNAGGGQASAPAPVATDVPGLQAPDTVDPSFTVDDVNMPALDTSNYKSKRKAAKALEQYAEVESVVDAKLATLIAQAQTTVTELTAKIYAERDAHITALDTSRTILATNIQSARDALFTERDAATLRVKAAIETQRGMIKSQSTESQGQVRSAASKLKGTIQRACDKSLNQFNTNMQGSKEDISTGIQDYKTNVASRLQSAQKGLAIPGYDDIQTCVHYRIREKLGKKFGDAGPILEDIQKLSAGANENVMTFFAEGQGKIRDVARSAKSAADTAKSSGTSSIRSQERSSLAALDITETKIESQLQTATMNGAARLDTIEATRNAAIDAAQEQAAGDAEQIRRGVTAAVWGCARTEAQRLIAATGNEAVDLAFKPKKKTVSASLSAAQGVQLDISAACTTATNTVTAWTRGHTTTRGELDGSGAQGAEGWRDEAIAFLTTAETRATESVTSTGTGSITSLKDLGQRHSDNLNRNGQSAKSTLTRTVNAQSTNLRKIGTDFLSGLDAQLGTAELENLGPMVSKARTALIKDFGKRASELYTAMFDAGLFNGTDETAVFTALRGIGAYGAGALAQVYKTFKKGRNLYSDLAGDLNSTEMKVAKAYLDGNDGKGAQLELAYYQNGWFGMDDEDAIKSLLKSLDKDQLADLKSQPGWKQSEAQLYDSLSDDDLDQRMVMSLVAGNKARSEALLLIDKITDARWNEDTDALRTLIAGIPEGERMAILTEFAIMQELAGKEGGLDALDFTKGELDPELAKQMGAAATDADGNAITVTSDKLETRNVTVAEQRFGDWVTQDNLKDDDLYKQGGPGVGNQIKKAFTSDAGLATTLIAGPTAGLVTGLYANSKDKSNQRVMGKEEKDLLGNQAMYGKSSLQGRAADVRYETKKGDNVEKAYDAMAYDHVDPDTGESSNSAFKTAEEREKAHAEWKEAFENVYQEQYNTSVSKDIKGADMDKKEKDLLNETRVGGQASAETMFDYAQDGMGTEEWAAKKALTGGSEADIAAYFKAHPEARERLLSEFSGDERKEIEIMMLGKVTTDLQRWKIAKIRYDFSRGSGSGNLLWMVSPAMGIASDTLPEGMAPKVSANLFWDCISGSGTLMDFNYDTMKAMIDERGGETAAFDKDNNLVTLAAAGTEEAIEELRMFRGHEESLEAAEKAYNATVDVYTELIATVVGLVVAAVLSVVTAGAASPMVLALASGLATIGTKAALKGGRYGWEEMAKDSALLAVEVATAGLADKMTKAVKGKELLKLELAGKAGNLTEDTIKLAKGTQLGLKTAETVIGSTGKVLVDETTYEASFQEGLVKGVKKVGLDVSTVWMDAFIDGVGDKAFEKSMKNAKSESWKDALTVTKKGVTEYGKGQGATLLGDVVNGTSEFGDKQDKLATAAMFSALKTSMSVRSDREAKRVKGISDDVNTDPSSDGYSQTIMKNKSDDATRKSELRKGVAGISVSVIKSAAEAQ